MTVMKKLIIAIMATLATTALYAGEPLYKLSSYRSSDYIEHTGFSYNDQRQLICAEQIYEGEYEVRDSLSYDADGNMVRIDGWQLLDEGFSHVYYVEFGYDADHNQTSRTNYNYIGGRWELGGVYTYTYEGGNKVLTELTMGGKLFQRIDYTYDANDHLTSEIWYYSDPFASTASLEESEKLTYEYNKAGLLAVSYDSVWDGSDWMYNGRNEYDYDENGNCTEFRSKDSGNRLTVRKVYHFDERLMADVLPWPDAELTRPETYNNHNVAYLENYYAPDVDGVLQYICDYIYTYIDINESGVANVTAGKSLEIYPNPAADMVFFGSDEHIQIFDMNGRLLIEADGGCANVQALRPGAYVVKSSDGTSKLIKR